MSTMTPTQPITQLHFDEPTFLKKIPFTLTKTAIPGVYSVPPPPAGFNPLHATQSDLTRNGLLFRQPAAGDPPAVQTAWNAAFSRQWQAKDRIIPIMEPQVGVTHNLRKLPTKATDTSYTGTVWSGAGTKTGKWTSIVGTWIIPTVKKPAEAQGTEGGWNSSSWIGIDGFFNSNDVLQTGIQQHVTAAGVASYVAWFEWYAPATAGSPGYIYQTNIANFPVAPGQSITATVQYVGTTAGSISIGNNTTGAHFSITLAPPPGASFDGASCEWIMEAPDGGEPTSSLPSFSPVTFTSALACGPNSTTANPASGDTLNITTNTGKVLTRTTVGNDTTTISFVG